MIRTRIKICGLTRPGDVDAAVALGADALGFVFYEASPRAVSRDAAKALVARVPAFVQTVGLFVNPTVAEVNDVLAQVPIDLLQFHGDESPDFCAQFKRPFIKAVQVRVGLDLLQYCDNYRAARAILLDAYHPDVRGGSGAVFDWALIPENLPLPVILSGGLESTNVREAIRRVAPYAVDVSSGVEISKGIKDPERIEAFVNGVYEREEL